MHFSSFITVPVAFLLLGMINPIQTYPQPGEVWAVTQNFTSSTLTPATFDISPQSYNVSTFLTSLGNLTTAFLETIIDYPENPLLSPLLHNPDITHALDIVRDAIRNTTPVVDTPSIPTTTAVVGSILPGLPVVNLRNLSPAPICYYVERTFGAFPLPAMCSMDHDVLPGKGPGIIVPANSTTTVYTPLGFNGAFNEITGGVLGTVDGLPALINGTRGARHEINYANVAGGVYYDISYEFGFSNSELGPSSLFPFANEPSSTLANTNQNGGHNPLDVQGEKDILAKVNKAWSLLSRNEKSEMAKHDRYLSVVSSFGDNDEDGDEIDLESSWLSTVKHDKLAPSVVKYFYQMTAGIHGYVYHGSAPVEAGLKEDALEAMMRPVSDKCTRFWDFEEGTKKNMTIAAYSNRGLKL